LHNGNDSFFCHFVLVSAAHNSYYAQNNKKVGGGVAIFLFFLVQTKNRVCHFLMTFPFLITFLFMIFPLRISQRKEEKGQRV